MPRDGIEGRVVVTVVRRASFLGSDFEKWIISISLMQRISAFMSSRRACTPTPIAGTTSIAETLAFKLEARSHKRQQKPRHEAAASKQDDTEKTGDRRRLAAGPKKLASCSWLLKKILGC
ncbi:hypothetical protein Nepgr_024442 [Nepenthes gracilis]|uniref:Uncharacterized protein n=1 Tax=Nepenthes gracilis TaxID=150966 RepID=A0AAD3T4N2_NEPGR|nr:hypothetical protein Nepgr_024442 [Nepenthes gracilis]